MAESWYKKLAQDVLTLEINTIIKEDMLAIKLPSSRRQALWELASMYNDK
jgi:hypothetical protein